MRMAAMAFFLAGSGLLAQQATFNGGVLAGTAGPTGDFADKRSAYGDYLGANGGFGLHAGGHFDLNFTPHHQLRFHLTVHGFASEEQEVASVYGYGTATQQNAFAVVQFGGDYVVNLASPARGAYFLVGLSFNQVKGKTTYSDAPDWEADQSGRVGFRLGAGYSFNRTFGMELGLNRVALEETGPDRMGLEALTWISVTAVIRFGR